MALNPTLKLTELSLDSRDATSSGDGAGAFLKYSWPLFYYTSRSEKIVAIKILQAEIPFVFDTINSSNNQFIFNHGGVDNIITITPGTYTGPALAAHLQPMFAAISGGFTVTWSSTTLRFSFHHTGAGAWGLFFPNRNTPYSNLGFLTGTRYNTTGPTTIVSPVIANVSGPYYLYLNSTRIGSLISFDLSDGATTGGSSPAICKIPITTQYGSIIFYNDGDPDKYFDFFSNDQFDCFDFYLTLGSDQSQIPLDMKGSTWSLKLGLISFREATRDLNVKPSKSSTIINV